MHKNTDRFHRSLVCPKCLHKLNRSVFRKNIKLGICPYCGQKLKMLMINVNFIYILCFTLDVFIIMKINCNILLSLLFFFMLYFPIFFILTSILSYICSDYFFATEIVNE